MNDDHLVERRANGREPEPSTGEPPRRECAAPRSRASRRRRSRRRAPAARRRRSATRRAPDARAEHAGEEVGVHVDNQGARRRRLGREEAAAQELRVQPARQPREGADAGPREATNHARFNEHEGCQPNTPRGSQTSWRKPRRSKTRAENVNESDKSSPAEDDFFVVEGTRPRDFVGSARGLAGIALAMVGSVFGGERTVNRHKRKFGCLLWPRGRQPDVRSGCPGAERGMEVR